MKRPKHLNVLGQKVRISYLSKIEDDILGDFDGDSLHIRVLDNKDWQKTLLHELLHACFCISGHRELLGMEKEEAIVRMLENSLQKYIAPF